MNIDAETRKDIKEYIKELDKIYEYLKGTLESIYKVERKYDSEDEGKYALAAMYITLNTLYDGFIFQYEKLLYKVKFDSDDGNRNRELEHLLDSEKK